MGPEDAEILAVQFYGSDFVDFAEIEDEAVAGRNCGREVELLVIDCCAGEVPDAELGAGGPID